MCIEAAAQRSDGVVKESADLIFHLRPGGRKSRSQKSRPLAEDEVLVLFSRFKKRSCHWKYYDLPPEQMVGLLPFAFVLSV